MAIVQLEVRNLQRPCNFLMDLDIARSNEKNLISHLFRELFYEPDTSRLFTAVLREGDSVIDVGANCGYFTMLAAALVGPSGRVLSFEPDPENCARLRNNVALNGFENVTIVQQPALDTARPISFFINSDDSGGDALWDPALAFGKTEPSAKLELSGTTIDDEATRHGMTSVKLIKTDIEGADHLALQGARRLLADAGVPFIISELHEFALARMGSGQEQFRAFMARHGYECFTVKFDGSMPHMVPAGIRITAQYVCNMLFSRPERLPAFWPSYEQVPGDLYGLPGGIVATLLS